MLRSFWRRTAVPLEEWHELTAPEDRERAELMGAVMALEPKYRLVIYLYYYEGLSVAETAAACVPIHPRCRPGLLRARARLRKELSEEEEKEGSVYVRPQSVP